MTRQDWIDVAIERLIKSGIDAVRVEPLAKEIGVTRGSFYWHFKSRRELLTAILEDWRQRQTQRIVEHIRKNDSLNPIERVVQLRMLPPRSKTSGGTAAFELAIRAWAMRDKIAKAIVEQVDGERLEFSTSLLVNAGLPQEEARHWALLGYAYTLGEAMLRKNLTDKQIFECRSRLLVAQAQDMEDGVALTAKAIEAAR